MSTEIIFGIIFIVLSICLVIIKLLLERIDYSKVFEEDIKKELKLKDTKKLKTFNEKVFIKRFTIKSSLLEIFTIFAELIFIYLYVSNYISLTTCIWFHILYYGALGMYYLLTQYSGGLYQNLILKDNQIDYVTIKYSGSLDNPKRNIQKVEFLKVYDLTISKTHINVNGIMNYTTVKKGKLATREIVFYSIPRVFDEEKEIIAHIREMKKNK